MHKQYVQQPYDLFLVICVEGN